MLLSLARISLMDLKDTINRYTRAYQELDQTRLKEFLSHRGQNGHQLEADDTRGYTRETKNSLVFYLNNSRSAEDPLYVDVLKEKPSAESKSRLEAQLLASDIVKEENLYGANRIVAADLDNGVLVREDEIGRPIKDVVLSEEINWSNQDFLNLMLTLDRLIKLDIKPEIDAENILIANDYDINFGFITTDYAYQEGYSQSFDSVRSRRNFIVNEIEEKILPEMQRVFPDEADELAANFQNWSDQFLDTRYLELEKNYKVEAKAFEPQLSSIASKIDHYKSIGQETFNPELTADEHGVRIGAGGECLVIEGRDPTKVAKIYYRGDGSAFEEAKALILAKDKGLFGVSRPLAIKDNIVIEERLPGKNLEDYLDDDNAKQELEECFKKFLPKFFRAFEDLYHQNIFPDPQPTNILLDPQLGFSFPDLCLDQGHKFKDGIFTVYNDLYSFTERIRSKIEDNKLLEIFETAYDNYIDGPSSDKSENKSSRKPR